MLPTLWKAWKITHLVFEKDTAGYSAIRDKQIKDLATEAKIEVLEVLGHTLYDPEAVVKAHGGKATMSAAAWHSAAQKLPEPVRPSPAPNVIPPPGNISLPEFSYFEDRPVDLNIETRVSHITVYNTIAGPNGDFATPTMEELGLPEASTSIKGGETEALRRLTAYCADRERVATFAKPKTSPAAFDPPETTLLSPYLKFGCLGSREFLWRVRDTITAWKQSGKGGDSTAKETHPPENLEGQLLFREMYYAAECAQGLSFAQNVYDKDGRRVLPRPRGDDLSEERFEAWKFGRTGFPWIDAIMRQLRLEGWIHHLARHSVACFLTRGQCYISWERGAEVFDEWLIDWDPCANPGNWMWLSCSAFFAQYYRVYGTVSFPTKYDKTGLLVRKFCPELAKFPDKYIYAPHLAPLQIQKEAGCVIGIDYPRPMLDEKLEKERCILRLKVAYKQGLFGSHKSVVDGSASKLLKDSYKAQLDALDNKAQTIDLGLQGEGTRKRKAGDSDAVGGGSSKTAKMGSIDAYFSK
ncbi:hypothetical protein HWV62_11133 [Athelia sp. TMB]|nr:hypothetical protein HWV62_18800 [Athelia sp. TMB]KAF7974874.1 hypothetical protein HWV62_11133 [Athelia sp. TMB]